MMIDESGDDPAAVERAFDVVDGVLRKTMAELDRITLQTEKNNHHAANLVPAVAFNDDYDEVAEDIDDACQNSQVSPNGDDCVSCLSASRETGHNSEQNGRNDDIIVTGGDESATSQKSAELWANSLFASTGVLNNLRVICRDLRQESGAAPFEKTAEMIENCDSAAIFGPDVLLHASGPGHLRRRFATNRHLQETNTDAMEDGVSESGADIRKTGDIGMESNSVLNVDENPFGSTASHRPRSPSPEKIRWELIPNFGKPLLSTLSSKRIAAPYLAMRSIGNDDADHEREENAAEEIERNNEDDQLPPPSPKPRPAVTLVEFLRKVEESIKQQQQASYADGDLNEETPVTKEIDTIGTQTTPSLSPRESICHRSNCHLSSYASDVTLSTDESQGISSMSATADAGTAPCVDSSSRRSSSSCVSSPCHASSSAAPSSSSSSASSSSPSPPPPRSSSSPTSTAHYASSLLSFECDETKTEDGGMPSSAMSTMTSSASAKSAAVTAESGIGTTSPKNRRIARRHQSRSKSDPRRWDRDVQGKRRTRSLDGPIEFPKCSALPPQVPVSSNTSSSFFDGDYSTSSANESTWHKKPPARRKTSFRRLQHIRRRESSESTLVNDTDDAADAGANKRSSSVGAQPTGTFGVTGARPKVRRLILRKLGDLASSSSTSTLSIDAEGGNRQLSLAERLERLRKWSHPVAKPHEVVRKLGRKSSSAPLLKTQISPTSENAAKFFSYRKMSPQTESRIFMLHYAEVEANEACHWLRAAGFPQYAQMYEDHQFPMDLSTAERDHPMLDRDALESLFRRLHTLNRCAEIRIDSIPKFSCESEEEESANRALSTNWQYEEGLQRWVAAARRNVASSSASSDQPQETRPKQYHRMFQQQQQLPVAPKRPQTLLPSPKLAKKPAKPFTAVNGSLESMVSSDSSPRSVRTGGSGSAGGVPAFPPSTPSPPVHETASPVPFRRSSSERFREGAKAILRRMESFKTTSSTSWSSHNKPGASTQRQNTSVSGNSNNSAAGQAKRPNRGAVVISGPIDDGSRLAKRVARQIQCVDLSPSGSSDVASVLTDTSNRWPARTLSGPGGSDAERNNNNAVSAKDQQDRLSNSHQTKRPVARASSFTSGSIRSGSSSPPFSLGLDDEDEASFYENVAPFRNRRGGSDRRHRNSKGEIPPPVPPHAGGVGGKRRPRFSGDSTPANEISKSLASVSSSNTGGTSQACPSSDFDELDSADSRRQHAPVVRWHSFQRDSNSWNGHLACDSSSVSNLSVGQLVVLKKVALLRLTALMEKHCPSLKNPSFHWDLPKLIRRIKPPDYKDKRVFGVPLHVVLQRTGHPIPAAILAALTFLRRSCLEAVGLFRKPGVRSRIEKLKQLCEAEPDGNFKAAFDGQLVYDVGDMVKQYFRELPEALLTNKLSETFLNIFQHLPEECREEAINAAILLMPDENRESLFVLLTFLEEVAYNSSSNQMTAANLAVCFAPSLFHLGGSHSRSGSPSPRRGGSPKPGAKENGLSQGYLMSGMPDHRDLTQQRAAHQCLTYLISHCRKLFTVPSKLLSQCEFNYLEVSRPVSLDILGQDIDGNWRTYMDACITGLMKETKDSYSVSKYSRWVGFTCSVPNVDVHFKKVGDGHPLRLWKISTECDAPPVNIMVRILRERPLWDQSLMKWKTVLKLDPEAEVLQMATEAMEPLPPNEFLVLRFWRRELPRGACAVVETSVEHSSAPPLVGHVRGVVLASRFLIEPCGGGRSKVTQISRVDMKGHSIEWYNKNYGHLAALTLSRLRESFLNSHEGPETKV